MTEKTKTANNEVIQGVTSDIPDGDDGLQSEITELLSKYPNLDRETITKRLVTLQADCVKLAELVLPGGVLPLYVSPLNPELPGEKQHITTWEQYNHTGKYGSYADNYCRPNEVGDYQYPRRMDNGELELVSCGKLVDSGLKELTNLTGMISAFISMAKARMLQLDTQSSDGLLTVKNRIDAKIKEYERLQQQYMQQVRMLDNNTQLIERRSKILKRDGDSLDKAENQFNIERDVFNEFVHVEDATRERNQKMIKWAKIPLAILWVIVAALALYLDIGHRV
jgi:hypothetical protein